MKIAITGVLNDGWQGIVKDGENLIRFGGYINAKGKLILPTFHYMWQVGKRLRDSNTKEVEAFILANKPDLNGEKFVMLENERRNLSILKN